MSYVLALTALNYLSGLALPIAAQHAIDRVGQRSLSIDLAWLAIAATTGIVVEALSASRRRTLVAQLSTFIDRRLSRSAFLQIVRRRADSRSLSPGQLTNRLQQLDRLRAFVILQLPQTMFDVGAAAISLSLMFYYDAIIALIVLLFAVISAQLLRRSIERLQNSAEARFHSDSNRQGILSETIASFSAVKAHGLETIQYRRWCAVTEDVLTATEDLSEYSKSVAVGAQLSARVLTAIVIGLGCIRMRYGTLTIGELLALQILSARAVGPVMTASDVLRQYQEANVAVHKLRDLWTEPKDQAEMAPTNRSFESAGIELIDLTLTYAPDRPPAIDRISHRFPERGTVAIVGRNGSGKSTLVRTILGLERNYEGRILVAGEDLRSYSPRSWRCALGTVTQDAFLFRGTIRENVDVTGTNGDEQIIAALEKVGALGFVNDLPLRLDTVLESRGNDLSGGQRQRIALARAIVRNPPIAIMDEPSSFLDAEAAVALEAALMEWSRDRLLILISHHLAATRFADRILMLQEGRLVGSGTHGQLLEGCPSYASLWSDYTRSYGLGQPGGSAMVHEGV
ncbi:MULTISPECIES: peptidase domain-containing ABC transporter [unclassified Bradyrhizobium]|uniref:peptidase domain-containing ABC transporter n=1 Tax=unclassified Bradyrhizobium TaxID=2631580 RepID=UPI001C647106|nr:MULTISPECIES: ATP-binding cassette domain-containing protein [unclassified Bradyrhizobium]MBW7966285.1 ATP-binding cassette domain-containing protein [Bradyrhizobium sp. BR 10261]